MTTGRTDKYLIVLLKVCGGLQLAVALTKLWFGFGFYAALDLSALALYCWIVYRHEGWSGRAASAGTVNLYSQSHE